MNKNKTIMKSKNPVAHPLLFCGDFPFPLPYFFCHHLLKSLFAIFLAYRFFHFAIKNSPKISTSS